MRSIWRPAILKVPTRYLALYPENGFTFTLLCPQFWVQNEPMGTIPDHVIKALEQMQREAARREEAAFRRGWDAAQQAIAEAAAKTRNSFEATAIAIAGSREGTPAGMELVSELVSAESNRERIKAALKIRPGMRPVEVYGYLAQMGLPVNRDSILTTIKRMRLDGEIRNSGVGIFLTGKEATN
jgi:hypothetical protein